MITEFKSSRLLLYTLCLILISALVISVEHKEKIVRSEIKGSPIGAATEQTPANPTSDLPAAIDTAPLTQISGNALNMPPGAPTYLAFVIHGMTESRLGVVELNSGQVRLLPTVAGEIPTDPLWSPDGSSLLYKTGSELMRYDSKLDRAFPFVRSVSDVGGFAFAFSANSTRVAVSQGIFIRIYSVRSTKEALAEFTIPTGSRFVQMLWTQESQLPEKLLVLTQSLKDNNGEITTFDTHTKTTETTALTGISGLLGWYQNAPVVIRYDDSLIGDEAAVLTSTGETKPLFSNQAEENDAGEYVHTFNSRTAASVLMLGADDSGDPSAVLIESATNPPRPWLTGFPYLDELTVAPQGAWAAFVDRSPVMDTGEQGGNIYVVGFGSDQAMLILEADPEHYTFASPSFRP